ncbi:hypothetical protein ABZ921_33560 [Streptomyces atriruber]|uniref:Uncharacterized protein n=1 Tax=Streptomyces atriruber TaxID=545121 RepID=A0ABV3BX27_9ACTN
MPAQPHLAQPQEEPLPTAVPRDGGEGAEPSELVSVTGCPREGAPLPPR